jgi:hypothetical protein
MLRANYLDDHDHDHDHAATGDLYWVRLGLVAVVWFLVFTVCSMHFSLLYGMFRSSSSKRPESMLVGTHRLRRSDNHAAARM